MYIIHIILFEWMIIYIQLEKQNYIQYNYTQRYTSYKVHSSVECVWMGRWVGVCMCVRVCVCVCVCIYMCVCVHIYVCVWVRGCLLV